MSKTNVAPALLAPPAFRVGGRQYLVALNRDRSYVGNSNLIAGAAFRPCKPGEVIEVYGIGFGPVTPPIPAGVVPTGLTALPSLSVRFGPANARTEYAGLAPGAIGLYQFNIVVPDIPDGDHLVEFEVAGVKSAQPVYLTVRSRPFIGWDFDSDTEGWLPVNTTASRVVDGAWSTEWTGNDPYLVGPPIFVSAKEFKVVQVRMQRQCSGPGAIYFSTSTGPYAEVRRVNFSGTASSGFAIISVPMTTNPEWNDDAMITGIRIDPCPAGPGSASIDFIRLSPEP